MTNYNIFVILCIIGVCHSWFSSNYNSRHNFASSKYKSFEKLSNQKSAGHSPLIFSTQLNAIPSSTSTTGTENKEIIFPADISEEWELDCYSRPVLNSDGKKLWEILITDSKSDFKYIKTIPSSLVNSRNLRIAVEEVIELSPVRPRIIRFFRNQMLNMITIALSALEVDVKPSRQVHNLLMWLQEREKNVYPKMVGYNAQLKQGNIMDYEVSQPERLPDLLKSESYAYVALPAEAFWSKEVNNENIKIGRLCPITDMPKTGWVHGITLFSKRADSIAAWMQALEIANIKADLLTRELIMNVDLNLQYVIAPLLDAQKKEAIIFEKGRSAAQGYHFLSVQFSPESEDVEGFWLLREFSNTI